jgi:Macrocin-O-methyltransferase (TylF)
MTMIQMDAPAHAAAPDTRTRYLDLMEKCLTGTIYRDPPMRPHWRHFFRKQEYSDAIREQGKDWPSLAHTMIGMKRLHSLREQVEATLRDGIPGDYIETGVWRGGACIMMRVTDRLVYCADSFAGVPPPDPARYPADRRRNFYKYKQLAVSLEEVQANFAAYGLLDDQVRFLKGLFSDTLPKLEAGRFALIRLDGDLYESTMDGLKALYHRLSPGGYVVIDDYGLRSSRTAVHDFVKERGESVEFVRIDDYGVYWQKAR